MDWNYIGIDPDPPKRTQILVLHYSGVIKVSNSNDLCMRAWTHIANEDEIKVRCQSILRGLPELRMVRCICENVETRQELLTALAHYREDALAQFTDLVRALDNKAHHGRACIPNFHR